MQTRREKQENILKIKIENFIHETKLKNYSIIYLIKV